jgi:hypothetical protein
MNERDLTPTDHWMRNLAQREQWPSRPVGPCPDDETLAARVEGGTLDVMRREALDNHLAGCDLCRHVVQDLVLDGAGEHLPSFPSLAAAASPGWGSALAALFPRRLVSGFAPIALTFVAVTALAAYAVPRAIDMFDEATQAPTPVKTVWSVTSEAPRPATAKAPHVPAPAPMQNTAPVAPAVAPAPTASQRPIRKVSSLTANPAPASGPPLPVNAAAVVLPKIEPAPVIKPPPVVEAPAPPPIPETEAFTEMDEVFADKYGEALGLVHDKKYGEALKRIPKLRAFASHAVKYAGLVNSLHHKAQRGLDKQQGPCTQGYVWGIVKKQGATSVERCVLPEQAEKILDF